MTLVLFKFTRPSALGVDVPAMGDLRLAPTRRRVTTGDPDTVILPAPFPAKVLDSGSLDLELAATGPDWCWELRASFTGVGSWTEYLAVPEPVPDPERPGGYLPVDYPDLVRVDPKTLEPSAVPDPAWWAALEAANATAADVEAARVAAAGSAVEAGTARDGAVAAAGDASESAIEAAGSASVAVIAAEGAHDDAVEASTRAVEAGAARAGAESARDATVAAAGSSESSALEARNASVASAESAAGAKEASDIIIEMTETGRLSETALSATIGELSGPVIDQKVAPALDIVARANAGEFDGKPGAPGNATVRVDTSVGKRVFISDGTAEHMISGDTGRRIVNHLCAAINFGRLILSRVEQTVYLEFFGVSLAGQSNSAVFNIDALPSGFRITSSTRFALPSDPTSGLLTVYAGGSPATISPKSGALLYNMVTFQTNDPWPTSLPGTPA